MRTFLAGHNGMVGSAIARILPGEIITKSSAELDLTNQADTRAFLQKEKPDQVILAAAKVGGILANNSYPAEFIYQNLIMQANVIHQAYEARVKKLLFLGSSCIYPKHAPQPMREDSLLTGPLEATNEPYAIAKISGIKMCESYNRQYNVDYRSIMPTNLYGPGDNFHPENSHVLPAMLRRFHEAKESGAKDVIIWGTGKPLREFLHVDDMASASNFLLSLSRDKYQTSSQTMCSQINVGTGVDISITQLAELVANTVGYVGDIRYDETKPDGSPRKLLDVSKLNSLGWTAKIPLEEGVKSTYQWYLKNIDNQRSV